MSLPDASRENSGIVVALPAEARSMGITGLRLGDCRPWHGGWVALSGPGPANATPAAERLLACGVRSLASWGIAGGLDPVLRPGDLLIADRVLDRHRTEGFVPDPDASRRLVDALQGSLRIRRGALWSSDAPAESATGKGALASRTGAVAVDMEAAAVAAVAARSNLPFVAVKAICDPAGREMPPSVVRAFTASGGVAGLPVLAAVFGAGPAQWRSLARLARDFASARRTLAIAARVAWHDKIPT
jgi:adenosylhomocysteine nucleosidase